MTKPKLFYINRTYIDTFNCASEKIYVDLSWCLCLRYNKWATDLFHHMSDFIPIKIRVARPENYSLIKNDPVFIIIGFKCLPDKALFYESNDCL